MSELVDGRDQAVARRSLRSAAVGTPAASLGEFPSAATGDRRRATSFRIRVRSGASAGGLSQGPRRSVLARRTVTKEPPRRFAAWPGCPSKSSGNTSACIPPVIARLLRKYGIGSQPGLRVSLAGYRVGSRYELLVGN